MDPNQTSNNLVSRNGQDINEMKGDPGQPAEPKSDKNDESVDAELDSMIEETKDHVRFGPLFKALEEKDWKGVEKFVKNDPQVLTSEIKICFSDTIFHLFSRNSNVPIWLLKNLVSMVDSETLENLTDRHGQPPIFAAALCGNTKAAEIFVHRNKHSPNRRSNNRLLPIHLAAKCGHKGMIEYLLTKTSVNLDDEKGVGLLKDLLNSGHYDVVHDLLVKYPNLAREMKVRKIILEMLASKPLAFESGSRLGFWTGLIYKCIPVHIKHVCHHGSVVRDIENSGERSKESNKFIEFGSILPQISNALGALSQKLYIMFWNALMLEKVPGIKSLQKQKLTYRKTLEIVRMMCHDVTWTQNEAIEILWMPLRSATILGIYEFVHEIMKAYYYCYTFRNKDDQYGILHLAILHRQENVFNLIRERKTFFWTWKAAYKGEKADTILHLAAKYVPSSQVPGAALQMQRELQWFKAVESFVHPSLQHNQNAENKTPKVVFSEEHQKLVGEGEKWMKENASSCSVVAALIVTIAFAAAFTVPGGIDSEGIPTFLHKSPLIIFVISDALALFFSTVSMLMFLGILTSRYSEEDFLVSLPRKLIIGLITLFISITSMMTAFGAGLYLEISDLWSGVYIPMAVFGGLTVMVFAGLQFPLLVEIVWSTYWPSIYQSEK